MTSRRLIIMLISIALGLIGAHAPTDAIKGGLISLYSCLWLLAWFGRQRDEVQREDQNEKVSEALRTLDAINTSGRLDYGDYCELHDAISEVLQ